MITQLDRCAQITGFLCALTLPIMVAATFVIVLLRYGFGIGSIALQEAILYLHSWIFLAGMSYCLKADAHVRVDILYRNFSSRGKAWVNALGGLTLLLPMCVVLLLTSWDFASRSWAIREVSAEADGLPFVYWLKTLLPLGAALLLLQCLLEVLANTLVLVQRPAKRTPAS
jgi:TRAP-type mannitol/chloroaromatic compound transport system permease small subunit